MKNRDLTQFLNALSENGIRFFRKGDVPSGAAPKQKFHDLFYRRHSHSQLEMICLLRGEMALCINGHWRVCRPLMTQVFVPGTTHGEHYLSGSKGYRMLWATIFPAAVFFHVTEYHPITGYGSSKRRMAITPPMCAQLWRISRVREFANDLKSRAKFHYLLMECVSFFLTEQADENMRTSDYHTQIVEQVKHYIRDYYWEDISLEKLARIVHYSPGHLNAIFRKAEKMPLHRYINQVRLTKAKQILANGDMLVKQAALAAGFQDPLYFSRLFNRRFGESPTNFMEKARQKIRNRYSRTGRKHKKQITVIPQG